MLLFHMAYLNTNCLVPLLSHHHMNTFHPNTHTHGNDKLTVGTGHISDIKNHVTRAAHVNESSRIGLLSFGRVGHSETLLLAHSGYSQFVSIANSRYNLKTKSKPWPRKY